MRRNWKIGNGFNRINEYGQSVLEEIGLFEMGIDEEDYAAGIERVKRVGSYYIFDRKCDWLTAIEKLRSHGYAV